MALSPPFCGGKQLQFGCLGQIGHTLSIFREGSSERAYVLSILWCRLFAQILLLCIHNFLVKILQYNPTVISHDINRSFLQTFKIHHGMREPTYQDQACWNCLIKTISSFFEWFTLIYIVPLFSYPPQILLYALPDVSGTHRATYNTSITEIGILICELATLVACW